MLVNDTAPIEDAHIFGVFSLYLNYINEKDTLYKKNLSIQYFEMCNDEFIGI